MRIVELRAENLKRIEAVSIKPDGSVVEITGMNGAGKTSVLDAIWWAIEGAEHIQTKPIRRGADKALIRLDLGEYVVTRTFNAKDDGGFTTSIRIENQEGARYQKPQTMLDSLVGQLSFDPLAFTQMKPREQFDVCRRFVPGVDFDALQKAHEADYSERTLANREARELATQAEAIVLGDTITTDGVVDEGELTTQLDQAGRHNAEIERRRAAREAAHKSIEEYRRGAAASRQKAEALRQQAEEAEADAKARDEAAATLEGKLAEAGPLPEPIDTGILLEEIERARTHNRIIQEAVDKQKQRADLERRAKAAEARAAALTKQMGEREEAKRAAIAKAKMPVPGLSFGADCVLLDDLPFEQASDAMQLRASMAIAAAMNPKLRVLRVRDGARLDPNGMKLLGEFAEQHDMQIWVETVASDRPGAVVIEAGRVKGAAETEAA